MPELTNIALRGLALGSRFVLLFFLARLLPPAEVGLYGLMAATVGYGIMALGLDFYTFATRELLSRERQAWAALIRDQGVVYGIVYVVELPLFLLLFYLDVLPWSMVGWFFILLVSEHLGQEINRLLIAIGRPLMANLVLFIRTGIWAWGVLVLMLLRSESRDLDVVFGAWAIGGIGAILLGIFGLKDLRWRQRLRRVNWYWIRSGIWVASTFLVATLCLRGIFTLDRFIVQSSAGLDLLGVYTFYIGMAMAATAFLDAGVFAFLYPRVVAAYRAGEFVEFCLQMRRLWRRTAGTATVLLASAAIVSRPVLTLLDRPIYIEELPVLWVLLLAVALYALGMVPHYGLYAFGRDRAIMTSHVAGLGMFLVVAIGAVQVWPLAGVAVGLVCGLGLILLIKLWQYSYWFPRLVTGTRCEAASQAP